MIAGGGQDTHVSASTTTASSWPDIRIRYSSALMSRYFTPVSPAAILSRSRARQSFGAHTNSGRGRSASSPPNPTPTSVWSASNGSTVRDRVL